MPRRVSLPGASELFRPTGGVQEEIDRAESDHEAVGRVDSDGVEIDGNEIDPAEIDEVELLAPARPLRAPVAPAADPEPAAGVTGRVRHDEKITVYVSADELLALEQARLTIRARYRKAVDRGRIVRVAVAAALADLEANGADSELMRRLDPS